MLAFAMAAALLWVLRQRMSLNLGFYLVAQLISLPVLEISYRILGATSKTYGAIYVGMTGLVFAAIGRLTWESLLNARYKARLFALAALLAMVFARVSFLGLGRSAEWFDWLTIVEGALLVICGTLIGMSAPYTKLPDISLGLSVLWLTQALIAFGFSLHFPSWNVIDPYARAIVGILGFLFLGYRLRARTHAKQAALHSA